MLLQEGVLHQWPWEAVGNHLCSWYIAQVDLSISSHICSIIVLCCNVYTCCCMVYSVFDTRNKRLWMGQYGTDGQNALLVQELRLLSESHTAYTKGIASRIGCGLQCRLLHSWFAVDCVSHDKDKSSCQIIVIRGSSIVQLDITS